MTEPIREQRGRTVRETWVTWAKRHRRPKPSWLVGWDDLDADQREVDMLIGEAVAEAERKRVLTKLLERHRAVGGEWGQSCGTCWQRGGGKAAWPCAESLAIGALLDGGL